MSTIITYKRLQIVDVPPGPAAGEALNENFQAIDDMAILLHGEWSNTQAYLPNDLVLSEGNYYLCTTANTDDLPPSGNWRAFAPALYQARVTLAYGAYGNPLDITTHPADSGSIQLTDGTTDTYSGGAYTANTPGFGNGQITLRGTLTGFSLVNTGRSYVIGVLLPGFLPNSDFMTSNAIDLSGCNLNAYALNALFDSLGHNGGENCSINVSSNPGSSTCDPTIATNKGWVVTA